MIYPIQKEEEEVQEQEAHGGNNAVIMALLTTTNIAASKTLIETATKMRAYHLPDDTDRLLLASILPSRRNGKRRR